MARERSSGGAREGLPAGDAQGSAPVGQRPWACGTGPAPRFGLGALVLELVDPETGAAVAWYMARDSAPGIPATLRVSYGELAALAGDGPAARRAVVAGRIRARIA